MDDLCEKYQFIYIDKIYTFIQNMLKLFKLFHEGQYTALTVKIESGYVEFNSNVE